MKNRLRHHTISIQHAFEGLFYAIKTQPNFQVHFFLSAVSLFFAWYFGVTYTEWMILIFTIILGLSGEMINTSIEAMTDLITKEKRLDAKIAKDVAAGMMLTIAIGSVIVAGCIFIPYIIRFVS